MTATLVVWAHPEPGSFTAAWARRSVEAAARMGAVATSDLYAMRFDPAERAELYGHTGPFDALKVQEAAAAAGRLPPDLSAELAKIRAADLVVLHFPIWWFGPPAMLKGWVDRALVHGALHRVEERFDAGPCRGKRVLFCVSTGCTAAECGPDGREGDLALQLWPLAHAFRYCGFEVLEPVRVHEVHGYHEAEALPAVETRLGAVLDGQADLLAGLDARAVWASNPGTDFDSEGRLRPEAAEFSPFIRHA
ncbi:NAD(P)H-dependent oxidoreductase [Tropicimonas sp. IMCC6043]|uniref:NAD(P)H-dependent oxidoreductase n=1 Tax=Tropicimonas sp. IMCC6043 TaxID=2510645 RepID=UPI00101CC05C|nr:NAD(P)H-dependent oxidoreductase [Tropicimonas sp. IMCC6043]RYH06865.1 flavodoxin family protein [Tropicimonas sp. IMCC6043]